MAAEFSVRLGEKSYSVWIGRGLLASAGELLTSPQLGRRCAVISDNSVASLHATACLHSLVNAGFEPMLLTIPAGENSKSMTAAEDLLLAMTEARLDRSSFIVALGGGVVGDLAGFVAAIYMRGIPCIQIPTTILAQVDSSIGGKTGVNLSAGKNLVGAFHQPLTVIADIDTLETLPAREYNSGFAEIIKHALIRDASMFEELKSFSRANLEAIIRRNIEIKAAIVAADEHELTGERALLNFGHTIGHGIEAAAGYGTLLHGEAISLGMIAAARLSVRKGGLAASSVDEIIAMLQQFELPVKLPDSITTSDVLTLLQKDKKFHQGSIRFVLLRQIGEAFLSSDVTIGDLAQEIEALH